MKRAGSPKNSMSKTMKYDEHNIPPPEELYKMVRDLFNFFLNFVFLLLLF